MGFFDFGFRSKENKAPPNNSNKHEPLNEDSCNGVVMEMFTSDTYDEFKRILDELEKNDIKFIELKLQTIDNKKIRFKPNKPFTIDKFKTHYDNIDFVKLDIIPFINNVFIEVSIIYKFNKANVN